MPFVGDGARSPAIDRAADRSFHLHAGAIREEWYFVVTDEDGAPRALTGSSHASGLSRDFPWVFGATVDPIDYCHLPAVVTRPTETLDKALGILATLRAKDAGHDETVMLLWSPEVKRMITGSDVLRCLLSGMGAHEKIAPMYAPGP